MSGDRRRTVIFAEFARFDGPYFYLTRLVRFLIRRGYEVGVVPTDTSHWEEANPFRDEPLVTTLAGQDFYPSKKGWLPGSLHRIWEGAAIARWVRDSQPKIDLVIFSVCTPTRFLARNFGGVRPVYIHHSHPHGTTRRPIGTLYRYLLSPSAAVVTVSQYVRDQFSLVWGFPPSDTRFHVLRSTTGKGAEGETLDLRAGDPPMVLTVGTVVSHKNPIQWIDTAQQILAESEGNLIGFVWVGNGELLEACRTRVEMLGISEQVKFVGYVNDPERYYRSATVYVQLSLIESLSLAAVDALKYGVPSVVANTGGLPETVDPGRTGYVVDLHDSKAIAGRIKEIAFDPLKWQEMSKSARAFYEDRFSEERWEGDLGDILLGRNPQSNSLQGGAS